MSVKNQLKIKLNYLSTLNYKKINYMLFLPLILIKCLDIYTTIIGLNMGGLYETNPLWYEHENNPILIFISSFWIIIVMIALNIIFIKKKHAYKYIMASVTVYVFVLIIIVYQNIINLN